MGSYQEQNRTQNIGATRQYNQNLQQTSQQYSQQLDCSSQSSQTLVFTQIPTNNTYNPINQQQQQQQQQHSGTVMDQMFNFDDDDQIFDEVLFQVETQYSQQMEPHFTPPNSDRKREGDLNQELTPPDKKRMTFVE